MSCGNERNGSVSKVLSAKDLSLDFYHPHGKKSTVAGAIDLGTWWVAGQVGEEGKSSGALQVASLAESIINEFQVH